MNKPEEVAGRLLIPRGHATVLFDLVPKALHQVAILVPLPIIRALLRAVFPRRNDCLGAAPFDVLDHVVAVVPFVADGYFHPVVGEQGLRLRGVGLLGRRQQELNGQSQAADAGMDLGPEAAAAAAQCLFPLAACAIDFFLAPAACGWARITVESSISHSKSGS